MLDVHSVCKPELVAEARMTRSCEERIFGLSDLVETLSPVGKRAARPKWHGVFSFVEIC